MSLNRILVVLCAFVAVVSTSCSNTNRLKYFQNLSDTARLQRLQTYPYQPLRLKPDDQLEIIVSSNSPEASQYFNRGAAIAAATVAGSVALPAAGGINSYTISSNGTVALPVLGDIPAAGLTAEELKQRITFLLKDYLKNVVVTVRLINLRVTVIGEVGHTSIIPVNGERINVLEALSSSGDLTIFAQRYNVKVMRHKKDTLEVANLDLNTTDVFKSPFFQLQQNDIVYVEPTKSKERSSTVISPFITLAVGAAGILFGLIALFR